MNVKDLQGSPAKDLFNKKHKTGMPSYFYACDIDLMLFDKEQGIVAILDYKNPLTDKQPTFVSCRVYDILKLHLGVPVYLVYATPPDFDKILVMEYLGFTDHPFKAQLKERMRGMWSDLVRFEQYLREGKKPYWEYGLGE